MKRILFALCCILLLFTFVSCSNKTEVLNKTEGQELLQTNKPSPTVNDEIVPLQIQVQDDWGITMSVSDVTAKGLVLTISQSGSTPDGELQTGSAYKLSRYENDTWTDVPCSVAAWNEIAYAINIDDTLKSNLDWSYIYGTLTYGKYRVEKEIHNYRAPGDFDNKIYYAEFTIE